MLYLVMQKNWTSQKGFTIVWQGRDYINALHWLCEFARHDEETTYLYQVDEEQTPPEITALGHADYQGRTYPVDVIEDSEKPFWNKEAT